MTQELDDYRWWAVDAADGATEEDKDRASRDRASIITALIRKLRDEQKQWVEEDLLHMSLYEGRRIMGYGLEAYWLADDESGQEGGKIAKNLVRKYTNAVVAKVGKNRPRPTFQTEDGDFELSQRAEGLQRYIDGIFYEADIYEKDLKWLQHTTVLGLSALKIFRTDDPTDAESEPGIDVDVALPGSIVVNHLEAISGSTRNLYQRWYIDKDVLAELYPKHAAAIRKVEAPKDADLGYWKRSNQVLVSEAWHLPSGPKATDGRHMLVLDNIALVDERYKRTRFPFVFMRYDDDLLGFRGCGLGYQLFGYQSAINKRLIMEERANHLLGNAKVFMPREAQVNMDEWTNEVATSIEYNAGFEPHVVSFQLFPPEFYQHLERLNSWAAEDVNISPMMSQGEKPPGITAAAALEALMNQDTEHFAKLGRRWEQGHMDIAEHVVELAREIHEGDEDLGYVAKEYPVIWRGGEDVQKIDWKEVNLKATQYHLKITPTSQMPTTVSAKLEMASELKQEGGLEPEEFMEMLGISDLTKILKKKTASRRYLEKTAASLLKGKWISPEPDDNLQLAVTFMTQQLQEAKFNNVAEAKLQLFRDYLLAVKRLLTPPPAPPGADAAAPGGQLPPPGGAPPPGAPPGAPPGPPGLPPPPMPGGPPPGAAMN